MEDKTLGLIVRAEEAMEALAQACGNNAHNQADIIRDLMDALVEWKAKADRLTGRGFEDLHYSLANAGRENAEMRTMIIVLDCTVKLLEEELVKEKRLHKLEILRSQKKIKEKHLGR